MHKGREPGTEATKLVSAIISSQVDAPCMLRKGLPRAFPGLEEVKGESIKEGTQYRSRVFIAPPELVHGEEWMFL